jgi:hypothetical protein
MAGWSDSSFTSTPITLMTTSSSGFPLGHALVTVLTNGIPSQSQFVLAGGTTPTPVVSISGGISYCSNPAPVPVPNVTLSLTGTSSGSMLSDGSGIYIFSSLVTGGSYTIMPTKTGLAPGSAGINTTDVIAIQRHFLSVTPLTGCRLSAADVNSDSSVTTVDVIAVQRFFLGLSSAIANVGKYQFNPANRSYSNLGSNQTNQNYDTLIFGDVAAPFVTP